MPDESKTNVHVLVALPHLAVQYSWCTSCSAEAKGGLSFFTCRCRVSRAGAGFGAPPCKKSATDYQLGADRVGEPRLPPLDCSKNRIQRIGCQLEKKNSTR